MTRAGRLVRALAATVAAAVVVVGCSAGEQPAAPAGRTAGGSGGATRSAGPTATPDPRVSVAVGASETVGVGADAPDEAWPRVLHDSALPGSTLVNVGVSGATVQDALRSQLPRALAAEPDVVTVWLVVNDIVGGVPVKAYESRLERLVRGLRRGGHTEVLLGNAPAVWRLPAYRACLPGANGREVPCLVPLVPAESEVKAVTAAFNAAVERVAAREGATLVDLSARHDLARLTAPDGFHPSTAGHREIAEVFASRLGA
jgi:lysophospholipase L1-like esterase